MLTCFCDRGAFTQEQSEKVLAAARKHGLGTRAHVCQFTAAKLEPLLEHQPASFDHMDCVQPEDISLLAQQRHGGSPAAGSKLFSWPQRISRRAAADRCWRAGGAGHRLQSRHVAHAEHAVRDVTGMHTHEDDVRRRRLLRRRSMPRARCGCKTEKAVWKPVKTRTWRSLT